jgi:GAF domain-containing protein
MSDKILAEQDNILFLESLAECKSPREVLEQLMLPAKAAGISAIRYYRLHHINDESAEELYSVEGVGCPAPLAERLRSGTVRKRRADHPESRFGTFFAIKTRSVILLSHSDKGPLQETGLTEGIPHLLVPLDEGDPPELKKHKLTKHPHWVDIPLLVGDSPIGKLSCDLRSAAQLEPDNQRSLRDSLFQFKDYAQLAAPFLELLRNLTFSVPLRNVVREISEKRSTDAILEYCVTGLKQYFRCEHADIFLSATDPPHDTIIVLQKTSLADKQSVLRNFYRLDRDVLPVTAWVASQEDPERVVRLANLLDPIRRSEQLKAYSPSIQWENAIRLSQRYGSLMVAFIPIDITGEHKLYGVIRLADKCSADLHCPHNIAPVPFDERDEAMLRRICRVSIGPALKALRQEESLRTVVSTLALLRESRTDEDALKQLAEIAALAVGQGSGTIDTCKKKFLVSIADEHDFEILHQAGDLELCSEYATQSEPLRFKRANSLTGYAMSSKRQVYMSDLVHAEQRQRYLPIAKGAVCGIATPMIYRNRTIGAIVVLSNHRDVSIEKDGYVLQVLANEAAAIYAHRRVGIATTLLAGAHHDIVEGLHVLHRVFESVPDDVARHGQQLVELLRNMTSVHATSSQPSPEMMAATARTLAIGSLIEQIADIVRNLREEFARCIVQVDLVNIASKVRVLPELMRTCLYHVFHNAMRHAPQDRANVIRVVASIHPGELRIVTENETTIGTTFTVGHVSSDVGIEFGREEGHGNGFMILRRILSWYRFPETTGANVEIRGPNETGTNRFEVALTFPLPFQEHGEVALVKQEVR